MHFHSLVKQRYVRRWFAELSVGMRNSITGLLVGNMTLTAVCLSSLTYNSASSTYTFITHPYRSYTFNASGQLTGESGPGGATLSLSYNTPSPGSI